MNELNNIKNILNSKLQLDSSFSQDDFDRLPEVLSRTVKASEDIKNLKLLDDATIDYLKNKNLISIQQANYIGIYRYTVCDYNGNLEESSIKILKELLKQIIDSIVSINKQVENKEIRDLLSVVDNRFFNITEEQLDLLFNTISESDYSLEQKRDMFLYISINSIKYADELLLENEEKEVAKGMSIEECIELFSKYGYDFNILSNANKLKFTLNGNYERVDNNFKAFQDNNIDLNNNCNNNLFLKKQNQLCEILIKTTPTCIDRIISTCKEHEFLENGEVKLYSIIESPSNFILRKREYKVKKYTGNGKAGGEGEVGSHQDYIENIEHFTEMCKELYGDRVNFLSKIYEGKDSASLLGFPHKRILEIERILQIYGFSRKDYFESATSVFSTMHHADVLDVAIELDVIDYLKKNQSRLSISLSDEILDLLYIASLNKDIAFSPQNTTNFAGDPISKYVLNSGLLRQIKNKTEIPRGINNIEYDENIIQKFGIFEERLNNSEFDIETALEMSKDYEINIVKVFENKFKKDDLVYEIEGIRISRMKVLRILSALNGIEVDKETGEDVLLLYILTRNSYLTKEQIEKVTREYKSAKEELMGRSL